MTRQELAKGDRLRCSWGDTLHAEKEEHRLNTSERIRDALIAWKVTYSMAALDGTHREGQAVCRPDGSVEVSIGKLGFFQIQGFEEGEAGILEMQGLIGCILRDALGTRT